MRSNTDDRGCSSQLQSTTPAMICLLARSSGQRFQVEYLEAQRSPREGSFDVRKLMIAKLRRLYFCFSTRDLRYLEVLVYALANKRRVGV